MTQEIDPIGRFENEGGRYSAVTLGGYVFQLRRFERWLAEKGGPGMLGCSRGDVEEYLDGERRRGLRASSVSQVLSALRAFYGWCLKRGLVESSPVAGIRLAVRERSSFETH